MQLLEHATSGASSENSSRIFVGREEGAVLNFEPSEVLTSAQEGTDSIQTLISSSTLQLNAEG